MRHAGRGPRCPDAEAKAWAWSASPARSTCPTTSSRRSAAACGDGGQEELTGPYVERYFADLPDTVEVRSGWVLADAAEHFFPRTSLTGRRSTGREALIADRRPDLSIRRRLVDEADTLARSLAVPRGGGRMSA